ncbi:MAG: hypothetical protein J6C37_08565 [Roseburia sp.]|nr:hypothetical protein [Roseburia sp.]
MKKYLCKFFKEFSYPEEACELLEQTYDRIYSDESLKDEFEELLKCYENQIDCDFSKLLEQMTAISSKADIHVYTGNMLLLICLSKTLKQYYLTAGVDEQIWFTSMCDLKYKLMECKCVYDIWGTFVPAWFGWFYSMRRFAFGKLQFEVIPFRRNYEKEGVVLTPDSRVINVHIPRTGTRLDRAGLMESYRAAAEFYKNRPASEFAGQPLAFVCHSWLLFPRNKEILSPQSNLRSFISDYDIIEQGVYDDYAEVWRLFDVNYNGDVEQLPQDTSFRRAYANWIRKGEKTGWGFGVFVYQ